MTDEPRDPIDELFDDRPTGQTVRVLARGLSSLGAKPCTMTVEFELPDNAETSEDGVRVQMEAAFHTFFGRNARHLTPNGEDESHDLREAISVDVTGDVDDEAVAEATERVREILAQQVEDLKQARLSAMMRSTIRPVDGPDAN